MTPFHRRSMLSHCTLSGVSNKQIPRRAFATAIDHGGLRLRGNCAKRDSHFAQDDILIAGDSSSFFFSFRFFSTATAGSSDFSALC